VKALPCGFGPPGPFFRRTRHNRVVEPPRKTAASRFAQYSGLALALPASTFVGYALGHWLDGVFGTHWLTILFLVLGSVAGFIQLIHQIMKDSRDDG
jgi:F0F1-type ATP synthase assembly protein I